MYENIFDMKCEKTPDGTYGCRLYLSPKYNLKERMHHHIFGVKKISVSSDHMTVIEKDKIFFKNHFENMMHCDTQRRPDGALNLMCQSKPGRPEVLIKK